MPTNMLSYSMLPVTIFVLANTVCVSQSAAAVTGRQRIYNLQSEAMGGQSQLSSGGDPDIPLQSDFISSSGSSGEVIPEWDTDKEADEEVLNAVPLPSGTMHFRYDEELSPENGAEVPRERFEPLFFNRMAIPDRVGSRQNTLRGIPARHLQYLANGGGVAKPLLRTLPLPQQVIRQQVPVIWTSKSNYGIPAEGYIRANGFDKRSPRCIARCMQQGMVHPLQCHSLC
ncbi:unnamed protein product [Orchesella dallaii]|uniref:Uncharacterized protein n=1 Tax=Orchesella dallaii TaxID=48710 RepID=A0ABP1RMA4_9HEXA